MIDLVDANIRLIIAVGVVLIAGLLMYIAFFKDSGHSRKRK